MSDHTRDCHCIVDADTDCCVVCGADHSDPCPTCSAAAFHADSCPQAA